MDTENSVDLEGKLSNCSVVNVDLKCSFKIFALSIDSVIASPSGPFKVVIPVISCCLASNISPEQFVIV